MNAQPDRHRYHHGDLRAALLEAAERRLRTHGVARLSLRDLAREVGVSHGAPRRHFPERQDLLDALAQSGFTRLGEGIRHAIAEGEADVPARIRRAGSAFAHFAIENAVLLELMNTTKHRPGALSVPLAAEVAFEPIKVLIREGQAQSILREGPPEEIGLILYATINGITTLVTTGAISVEQLDDLTHTAVDLFLRGAAP
jgi:AcrR family transcriptional regulator